MKQTDYFACVTVSGWCKSPSYSSHMKKIAFTYNSCIGMILFLPDFECIDMHGGA